ncbi:hypothetical protein J6590_050214 [Homalodisca vitripennis]|nr:hypothetical protein J6590_050214 [Homalodisca vitripennis]
MAGAGLRDLLSKQKPLSQRERIVGDRGGDYSKWGLPRCHEPGQAAARSAFPPFSSNSTTGVTKHCRS